MLTDQVLHFHHIGYATNSIGSIAETYATRFGYELSTEVIHDPLQTAFVQFLKLPGDSSYLELVAPDGPGSKLSGAVKGGRVLNHICYTSGPLEEAIASLEKKGMRLIVEPKPAKAFAGRRICWLIGQDPLPIELVERKANEDRCVPGLVLEGK